MTRAELIQYITDNVYPNARNEVTAPMVRDSLLEIVDFLGDAATYNIGMVASGNQGLVTGGNVNTAIALALLPYYTAQETGQAIDDAIARIGLGQAAYKNIGQVAENNTDLVTGGQVYTAINTALTSAIKFQGISDTPLTDGSTTNPIQINGQSYTAKKGDMVVYGGNEFLWVGNKWQQMGDESSYALKTISISGTGYLTGGGDLTQSRTLDISATAKGYIDHGEAAYNYFPGGVLDSTHLPSMYIGTTSVQFTAVAQNLTGISSVRATSNVLTLFEWDVTNSAWHFHGNIYTDGWFSGGGISPGGGGGGGGIDPEMMWKYLTNDPTLPSNPYANTKIAADHINFPVTSVVGLGGNVTATQIAQALNLGSFAYKNSLSVSDIPDLSGTYVPKSSSVSNYNVWNNSDFGFSTWQPDYQGIPESFGTSLNFKDPVNSWYYRLMFGTGGRIYVKEGINTTTMSDVGTIAYTSDFANYLPLTGGTMSNTNLVTNLNADLLDGKNATDFSYKHQTSFDFNVDHDSNIVTFDQFNSAGAPNSDWYNGFVSTHSNYLSSYIINSHRTNNWYVGWYDAIQSAGLDWCLLYHSGNSNKSSADWTCRQLNVYGGTYNYTNSPIFMNTGGDGIYIGNAGIYYHNSNNTWTKDLLYFTSGGNIGVNTSSPSYNLEVSGSFCATSVRQNGNLVLDRSQDTVMRDRGNYKNTASVGYKINDINNWINTDSGYGGFNNGYGTSMMIVGEQTWCNRLDFGTNGVVDLWQGINTTTMTKIGMFWTTANAGAGHAWACSDLNASNIIYAVTGIYTDGWFSGGGVASSSDRRLKKNIKNFAYTPKLLLAIRPREWDWKDGSAMVGHAAGFVAQEIEPIMPYAVDGTRNFKALFYDRFHALEIAGLQDHERRIVELERAVKERDAKIKKLEKMLKLN